MVSVKLMEEEEKPFLIGNQGRANSLRTAVRTLVFSGLETATRNMPRTLGSLYRPGLKGSLWGTDVQESRRQWFKIIHHFIIAGQLEDDVNVFERGRLMKV